MGSAEARGSAGSRHPIWRAWSKNAPGGFAFILAGLAIMHHPLHKTPAAGGHAPSLPRLAWRTAAPCSPPVCAAARLHPCNSRCF